MRDTVEPATTAVPLSGWTVSRLLMVQVKFVLTDVVLPSLTVTLEEKIPVAEGVPETRPELGLIDSPVGSPVALHVSRSPFASVACNCRLTKVPITFVELAGLVSTGCDGKAKAFTVRLQLSMS